MTEIPTAMHRDAADMCKSSEAQADTSNVQLIAGEGWELTPLQMRIGYQHERTETASSLMPMTVPPGFTLGALFRSPTDQSGATTGANANLASTADSFYWKRVAASTTWDSTDYRLDGDQSAYPAPDTSSDTLVMDRVAITNQNHDPNKGFFLRFVVRGSLVSCPDVLHGIGFCGPAGTDRYATGTGQYWIKVYGDGSANLYEWALNLASSSYGWRKRTTLRLWEPQRGSNSAHWIYIRPVTYSAVRNGSSGSIHFFTQSQNRAQTVGILAAYTAQGGITNVATFRAVATGAAPSTSRVPIRIDQRRNQRHKFQPPSSPVYPTSGTLRCDAWSVDSFLFSSVKMRAIWLGSAPAGTSLAITLFDALTDVALTSAGSGTWTDGGGNVIGGYTDFTTTFPQRQYYAKVAFTGDGSSTPILESYRIQRDGFAEDINPGETTTKVTRVSVVGQESDPTHESGSVTVKDPAGSLSILDDRGTIPCAIETDCTLSDGTPTTSVLFRGYVQRAEGERKGSKVPQGLGNATLQAMLQNWKSYDLTLIGAWLKLQQAMVPCLWNFSTDTSNSSTGQAPKITDIIKTAFHFGGVVDGQLDVPDNPLRFFATTNDDGAYLTPYDSLADFILHLTRDYLGQWICFDPNAQVSGSGIDRGIWRLRPQNVPDGSGVYNTLAHFHSDAASDANALQEFALGSYQASYPIIAAGTYSEIQNTFIRKGTLKAWTRPPEANLIIVTGTGKGAFDMSQSHLDQMTAILPNYQSYNFAGLSSGDSHYPSNTNPDWLPYVVPYLYANPQLRTPDAVQYVAERIFQRIAHGSKMLRFEAPLLLVMDKLDSLQIRPRPLRFYDAVKVNGYDFFVRSCSPTYRKDKVQMAIYELEIPNGVLY